MPAHDVNSSIGLADANARSADVDCEPAARAPVREARVARRRRRRRRRLARWSMRPLFRLRGSPSSPDSGPTMRSLSAAALLTAGVLLAGLGLPGPASAAACTSTPATARFADGLYDSVDASGAPDPAGSAPDIVSVEVDVAPTCQVTIGATLEGHATPADSLAHGETIVFSLDVDGNRATGAPPTGADRQIVTYGTDAGPDVSQLGTWTAGRFAYQDLPTASPWGRETLSLAALGITSSTRLEITAAGTFVVGAASWSDLAPAYETTFAVPIALDAALPSAHAPAGCKVPDVRGMPSRRARRRLRAAGCRTGDVAVASRCSHPGRVISTSPSAGRLAIAPVTVRLCRPRGRPG
jgi:hypothetical protein